MASTSLATKQQQSVVPLKEAVLNYVQYPAPLARYEDVAANPKLFMETLEKLHGSLRTKFMIPIIGGRELDLHRLFVEVTSRGGFEKIIRERRWKEVTSIFNFPSTATNASFVLRKYYSSLLHHYEQLYYFKSRGWTPGSAVPFQTSVVSRLPSQVPVQPSPEYQAATSQQHKINTAEPCGVKTAALSESCQVMGVIDGKFESGYLVTVTIGAEKLQGVLYQAANNESPCQVLQNMNPSANNAGITTTPVPGTTQRRRRRKKNEIKRRDPAHPKPNRSGYNFFFAEQHARLKPLYPGRDREISRMIGELWNKLNEPEKSVYQDKAVKDKERYRTEMEDYKARLKGARVISNPIPIQQWVPEQDSDMKTDETEGGDSLHTVDNESSCGVESDYEDESNDKPSERNLERVASFGVQLHVHSDNNNMDIDHNNNPGEAATAFNENNGDGRVGNVGGDENLETQKHTS